MEVRNISQGGQSSFDNIGTSNSNNSTTVVTVSQPIVNTTPKVNADNSGGQAVQDKVDDKDLKKAVDKLTAFLADDNTSVEYQYHNKFRNDLMITIVDKTTKQVLLEVPPKRLLDLVAKMMEMVGVIFDKKA